MSQSYFSRLNYTLANEDTSLELGILPERVNHVMSVAGSGGRVLPLLAQAPRSITCVDLVQEQLYLTELRVESLRAFQHEEFLGFWGYPPNPFLPQERKAQFQRIQLSPAAHRFLLSFFEQIEWRAPIYEGKWEKTISQLSQMNRLITRKKGAALFAQGQSSDYDDYFKTSFPHLRWKLLLLLLGNSNTFNALLYKGSFPRKNIPTSYFQFYKSAFDRLFHQGPSRENFLLQLLFFGKILYPEGNPIECDRDVFKKAQTHLRDSQIRYVCGDIISECEKSEQSVDFLSLSDVPSYFSGELERNYMQRVRKGLSREGIVVLRHYLRVPEKTALHGFCNQTSFYSDLSAREKVQMYQIEVFRHQPSQERYPS